MYPGRPPHTPNLKLPHRLLLQGRPPTHRPLDLTLSIAARDVLLSFLPGEPRAFEELIVITM